MNSNVYIYIYIVYIYNNINNNIYILNNEIPKIEYCMYYQ